MITAIHGILDASNKTLSYSNAGHNPPLLLKANGESRYIYDGEQPLGMFPRTRYHENHLMIEPGDIFVLYTDGATEAESPTGEEFGRERLEQVVKEHVEKPARELIASLQMEILEWTGGVGFGRAVAAAGDVNKDGYPDVFVGDSGDVWVFSGKTGATIWLVVAMAAFV